MDPTVLASLIGLVGMLGTGVVGYIPYRSAKKLRSERVGIEQQTVNQAQFDRFTAALERRMAEADHEVANLQVQQQTNNRLLRAAVHHIDSLYVWIRVSATYSVSPPVLPTELAELPLVWTEQRPHSPRNGSTS